MHAICMQMKSTATKTKLRKTPESAQATTDRTSVNVGHDEYKRAAIAARLLGETVRGFAEKALNERSEPVLKKHGVKLPQNSLAAA
jgi:hypothetical protein